MLMLQMRVFEVKQCLRLRCIDSVAQDTGCIPPALKPGKSCMRVLIRSILLSAISSHGRGKSGICWGLYKARIPFLGALLMMLTLPIAPPASSITLGIRRSKCTWWGRTPNVLLPGLLIHIPHVEDYFHSFLTFLPHLPKISLIRYEQASKYGLYSGRFVFSSKFRKGSKLPTTRKAVVHLSPQGQTGKKAMGT